MVLAVVVEIVELRGNLTKSNNKHLRGGNNRPIYTMNKKLLDDDSLMPFGKFEDDRMEDVPASYLHWFWVNGNNSTLDGKAVRDYIKRNLTTLQDEYPDGIWK